MNAINSKRCKVISEDSDLLKKSATNNSIISVQRVFFNAVVKLTGTDVAIEHLESVVTLSFRNNTTMFQMKF